MQRIPLLVSTLCLSFTLSGCASIVDGNIMPRGYKSYNKTYKTAPGAEAPKIGYAYSAELNAAHIQELGVIAQDLAEKLDSKISFSAEKIYLRQPSSSLFYNSFDYVLREALTQRGYLLANAPDQGLVVDVIAKEIDALECGSVPEGQLRVLVALALDVDTKLGMAGDYVDGLYTVPSKGFKSEGIIAPVLPSCAIPKPTQ